MIMQVELNEQEWNLLLNSASLAPYAQIAPLLNKVVEQLKTKEEKKIK